MLSFGIEYERAFSIAFWRARLPAGSGPPSRAATMIARESLEKSLPRRASAAPFLCLIDDHLLCPDIAQIVPRLWPRSEPGQEPSDLVTLGPRNRPPGGVTDAGAGLDGADDGRRMAMLGEDRQCRLDPLVREDREQRPRGEGRPGIDLERATDGEPGLEPEDRLAVDADAHARGIGHLVQSTGQASFSRIVEGLD